MISVHQSAVQLLDDLKPVQFNWWFYDTFTRIFNLRSRANLLQTDNDIVVSTPTLTAFFTDIIDMSPEWHSWFLMFFSTFFGSLIKQTCSTHRLSSFRNFIVPFLLSLCILRPIFSQQLSVFPNWLQVDQKLRTRKLRLIFTVILLYLQLVC